MLGKILVETRTLLRYQIVPVPPSNYWVINNILLIGEINVENLNKVDVNFLLDLSGQQTISNKILGQDLHDKVYLLNQRYVFVHSLPSSNMLEDNKVDLLIEAIGKKYICYVYGGKEQYTEFLTVTFTKLYELPLELARQLTERLLQIKKRKIWNLYQHYLHYFNLLKIRNFIIYILNGNFRMGLVNTRSDFKRSIYPLYKIFKCE